MAPTIYESSTRKGKLLQLPGLVFSQICELVVQQLSTTGQIVEVGQQGSQLYFYGHLWSTFIHPVTLNVKRFLFIYLFIHSDRQLHSELVNMCQLHVPLPGRVTLAKHGQRERQLAGNIPLSFISLGHETGWTYRHLSNRNSGVIYKSRVYEFVKYKLSFQLQKRVTTVLPLDKIHVSLIPVAFVSI